MRRGLALALCLIGLAGCSGGDGHSRAKGAGAPALTVPETTSTPQPTTDTTTQVAPPPTTTTAPSGGGAASPQTGQPGSPQNNQPPPSGSPASRFERFCRENPGACGN